MAALLDLFQMLILGPLFSFADPALRQQFVRVLMTLGKSGVGNRITYRRSIAVVGGKDTTGTEDPGDFGQSRYWIHPMK